MEIKINAHKEPSAVTGDFIVVTSNGLQYTRQIVQIGGSKYGSLNPQTGKVTYAKSTIEELLEEYRENHGSYFVVKNKDTKLEVN